MLEEPADKLKHVEVGGTWTRTSRSAVGEGDGAALERDDLALEGRHSVRSFDSPPPGTMV